MDTDYRSPVMAQLTEAERARADALRKALKARLRPVDMLELVLIERIVVASVKLRRVEATLTARRGDEAALRALDRYGRSIQRERRAAISNLRRLVAERPVRLKQTAAPADHELIQLASPIPAARPRPRRPSRRGGSWVH
ncbi:MAG: hypothetical protein U1E14_06145 [Geminicoccaceae bacterium]